MADIISRFTAQNNGNKIIVGFGISSHSVEEQRLITRKELDEIYAEKPLLIVCYDGHSLDANSKPIDLYPGTDFSIWRNSSVIRVLELRLIFRLNIHESSSLEKQVYLMRILKINSG